MAEHLSNANHNYLRYANCWEDASILLQSLQPKEGSKICSICSAGDNSFALLTTNPELVVAADINEVQLFLSQLKKEAIRELEREEFLEFLGVTPSKKRVYFFNLIKSNLPSNTRNYWEQNLSQIENGLIYVGKFEKYLTFFSKRIMPLIHSKQRINELFTKKSRIEQIDFLENVWDNWRWRSFFKLFFSKSLMGYFGRSPEFLKEVDVNVSSQLLEQGKSYLLNNDYSENYFLQFILTGSFGEHLPYYLQEENYCLIRQNINQIQFEKCFVQNTSTKFGKYDSFNLSNIFEYMPVPLFEETSYSLLKRANQNACFAYLNLLVPRKMSSIPEIGLEELLLAESLRKKDKGFFYSNYFVDQLSESNELIIL